MDEFDRRHATERRQTTLRRNV